MSGLNRLMVIGHVGTDPEMRYTPSGSPFTTFRLAVDRTYKDASGERHQNTEWFTAVTWNTLAENVNAHVYKGMKVYAEGRLHSREWTDNDGNARHQNQIQANTVLFLSPLRDGSQGSRETEPVGAAA